MAKAYGHKKCKSEVEVIARDEFDKHTHENITGVVDIEHGGTGSRDAASARRALGITPANIDASHVSHGHTVLRNGDSVYSGFTLIGFEDQASLIGMYAQGNYSPTDNTMVRLAFRVHKDTGTISMRVDSKAGTFYPTLLTTNNPPALTDCDGILPVDQGGTGANNIFDALPNLGLEIDNGVRAITASGTAVRFGRRFSKAPSIILTPATINLGTLYVTNVTTTGFTIKTSGATVNSGTVHWLAVNCAQETAGI